MTSKIAYGFLSTREEISHYWNKQVCRFQGAVDLDEACIPSVDELLISLSGSFKNGLWFKPEVVNINASKLNPHGAPSQRLSIDIDTALDCYSNGFSICFGDLSSTVDAIFELRRTAVDFFGHQELVFVTGYLSPPGATGILHYDRQHNFFIQREGVKRWYVSEVPAIKNPHENLVYSGADKAFFEDMRARGYNIALPADCGRQVYDLSPGDVLYIPPGYYHSPETLETHSLHYTLTVEPACFWRDLNKKMASLLLAQNEMFFEDYRFLSEEKRSQLYERCKDEIIDELNLQG